MPPEAERSERRLRLLLALVLAASALSLTWVASAELDGSLHWDESHSLRNVRSVLRSGSLKPAFPWYPALSHLPQVGLLKISSLLEQWTGMEIFAVATPRWVFTPTAYFLCRMTSVAYGTAALCMIFVVGRSLFSPAVGLLAAFLTAATLTHLRFASMYKPDTLVLLLGLVALWLSLRVVRRSSWRDYLLAGAAIGAASAAKQIGAFSAIPLVVATVLDWRDRVVWARLAAAALVSGLVFFVFNPFIDLWPRYLSMGEQYRAWAAAQSVEMPPFWQFVLTLPINQAWYGPVVGVAVWLGLVGLGVAAWRQRLEAPGDTRVILLLLATVALVPAACAMVSTYPKGNNFLPLMPLTSLAGAWFLVRAWQTASPRLDRRVRPLALWGGLLSVAAVMLVPYGSYAHWRAVPETTSGAAADAIQQDAGYLAHRTLVREADLEPLDVGYVRYRKRGVMPLELAPESLSQLGDLELDLADYEIFPARRLQGPQAARYLERRAQLAPASVWQIEPRLWRRRGMAVVVLAHPWRRVGEVTTVAWSTRRDGKSRLTARVPSELVPGQVISLDLAFQGGVTPDCSLRLGRHEEPLHLYLAEAQEQRFMTRRLIVEKGARNILLECRGAPAGERPDLGIARWMPAPGYRR